MGQSRVRTIVGNTNECQGDFQRVARYPDMLQVSIEGRLAGKPYSAKLDIEKQQVVWFDPGINPEAQPASLKMQVIKENKLALTRAATCVALCCSKFSWDGRSGPTCRKQTQAGCSCKEFIDPKWECPLKLWPKACYGN